MSAPDFVAVGHVTLDHFADGDIDWTAFLGALEQVGYRGWLTIKRGVSPDPVADLRAGVGFLRRMVG